MNVATFLESLRCRGTILAVDGDKLVVDHNGRMTEADREFIRTHKAALLRLLSESASVAVPQSNLDLVVDLIAGQRGVPVSEVDGGRVIGGCEIKLSRPDRRESREATPREQRPALLPGLFPAESEPAVSTPGSEDRSSCPYPWVTPRRLDIAAKGDELRRRGLGLPLCLLPEDAREERAAIMEFDGGLTREAAEHAAGLTSPGEKTP